MMIAMRRDVVTFGVDARYCARSRADECPAPRARELVRVSCRVHIEAQTYVPHESAVDVHDSVAVIERVRAPAT